MFFLSTLLYLVQTKTENLINMSIGNHQLVASFFS